LAKQPSALLSSMRTVERALSQESTPCQPSRPPTSAPMHKMVLMKSVMDYCFVPTFTGCLILVT
jgi:hypothetical protein